MKRDETMFEETDKEQEEYDALVAAIEDQEMERLGDQQLPCWNVSPSPRPVDPDTVPF